MKKIKNHLADGNNKVIVKLYQTYIKDLYSEINKKRDFADIYGYLHRNVGLLSKSIESDSVDPSKFILPISWLFSLATKLDIDILEALIKKFPGICPYCLETHCVCYRTNKKPLRPMSAFEIGTIIYDKWGIVSSGLINFDLDSAVTLITNIYRQNEAIWKSAGSTGFQPHILKIHQEMTEIHEAYGNLLNKKKPLNAVMDEVADVFAWILSAWAICFPNASLDTAFVNYYDNGCPVCASAPCKCGLSDSRPATLPDFGKVALVKENLEKLALEFPGHQKEFSSLLESYQKVLETQNIPLVVAVLSDTRLILEQLRKVVPTLGVEVEVVSMLSSTLRTVDAMLKAEGVRNPSEKSFDVFLSYSTANKDQARAVYDFLISKNVRVFMSEKEIHPSSNWKEAIKDALRSIKLLCIIASPESLDSEWVKTEVDAAWALDIPILPVLYQCAAKNLPDIIREYQFIDYHEYQKIIGVLENSS